MKLTPIHGAALFSFAIAILIFFRITQEHARFQKTVRQSLMSSEGYDQKFIDLVNHLEDILATRATFSYQGGVDPMTGRQREVSQFVPTVVAKRASPTQGPARGRIAPAPKVESDPIRLTALIADDFGRYTAIIMNGERSLSVDVGDAVGESKVVRITSRDIVLSGNEGTFTYSLSGGRSAGQK